MKSLITSYWKSITWALVILVVCLIPSNDLDKVRLIDIPYMDKYVHLGLYFIFTVFLISEVRKFKNIDSADINKYLGLIIAPFIYGLFIEFLQYSITTTRSASIWDVFANTIGIVLALLNYKWISRVMAGRV